jgi:hypothetical protein
VQAATELVADNSHLRFKVPDEAMKFRTGAEKRLKIEGWIQA